MSLTWIMQELDKTPCKKWMFFLDACHAGTTNLHDERSVTDTMSDDELRNFFQGADHKVCFAACKFSQKSLSSGPLKHGVWTYHILKALRGEEHQALLNGKYLTANTLQDYLSTIVPVVARALRTDHPKQTPVMYGSLTNNFEIADLGALISQKKASSPASAAYWSAAYKVIESVSVKSLTGFKKSHTVPQEVNSYTKDFVQRIAAPDVKERVEERFAKIRRALSLKRTEIRKEDDRIITKDFEYRIWCDQNDDEAGEAVFFEELSGVNPDVLGDEDVNNLFESSFNEMVLSPKKKINVEALVDIIEGLHSKEVEVEYDSDGADCVVRLRGDSTEFYITPNSVTVRSSSRTNPIGLIQAFAATRGRLVELAGPTLQLLT